jgi:hypothetical protein
MCCNTECTGVCGACSAAKKGGGFDGNCGFVAPNTDPDDECSGTLVCNGTGECKKVDGDSCGNGSECLTGNCVDGVCCNAACGGPCEACSAAKTGGADGICGPIPAFANPDGECVSGQACDGHGTCKDLDGQGCVGPGECISTYCTDGVCCDNGCAGTCQACSAALKGGGADGECGNVAPYGADPACGANEVCDGAGTCRKNDGIVCGGAGECVSGNCIDGVCCDDPCSDTCLACTAAKTGGVNGQCGFVTANSDPDTDCPLGTQACDGAGACREVPGGVCSLSGDCISGNCSPNDGVCCSQACTGTCMACTSAKTGSPTGTCANVVTGTDPDNECTGPGSPDVCHAGHCDRINGTACVSPGQCLSGNCPAQDSVCCDLPCDGLCYACTAAKKGSGANGTCGFVAAATDPDLECNNTKCCSGSGTCVPGSCP